MAHEPPQHVDPPPGPVRREGRDGHARAPAGHDVRGLRPRLARTHAALAGRRWIPVAAGLAAAAVVALVAFREPVADRLWPETRAQSLQAAADAALAAGRLTAPDGGGARELYEAALAIDPDRAEARAGLARVAHAALARAAEALGRNDFADAHRQLALARALSVPQAPADRFAEILRRREAAHAGVERLLAQAEAARAAGLLSGSPEAALPLYRRVLALQPDRVEALRGREDALGDVLAEARQSLRTGALDAAAAGIALAREFDRGHVDLPDTEARLTEEADALRRRADRDLRRGRLAQATAAYRQLLALDAGDAAAQRGLAAIAAAHATRATRYAADFDFARAEGELARARTLAPAATDVAEASRSIARSRQARARLVPSMDAKRHDGRVRVLLEEAAAAEARGDLLSPPGDSAFDKLRAARALAPDAPAVRAASARLVPAATACFERELRGNNLARARACLDALSALSRDDAAVRTARRKLAERWLAVGDERLAAGELQSAGAALAAARNNDPAVPGIPEFAERLRTATASGD